MITLYLSFSTTMWMRPTAAMATRNHDFRGDASDISSYPGASPTMIYLNSTPVKYCDGGEEIEGGNVCYSAEGDGSIISTKFLLIPILILTFTIANCFNSQHT